MKQMDALLAEFNHESGLTRKHLERLPEDKLGWKPHDKSMTLGRLSGHLAEIPGWGTVMIESDSFDMASGAGQQPASARSVKEALDLFDQGVEKFQSAARKMEDASLFQPWRLMQGEHVLFELPRGEALRAWVLHHGVHHRAQLGLYLRLLEVAVPSVYGPSADENPMGL